MPPEQQAPTPPQVPPTTFVPPPMTNTYSPAPVTPTPTPQVPIEPVVQVAKKSSWLKWLLILLGVFMILIVLVVGGLIAIGFAGQSYLKTVMQFNPVDEQTIEQLVKEGIPTDTTGNPYVPPVSDTSTSSDLEEFAGSKFDKVKISTYENSGNVKCSISAESMSGTEANYNFISINLIIEYCDLQTDVSMCRKAGVFDTEEMRLFTYQELADKFPNINQVIDIGLGGMITNKGDTAAVWWQALLTKRIHVSLIYASIPDKPVGNNRFFDIARKIESRSPVNYK
jgi:hypothetical protein